MAESETSCPVFRSTSLTMRQRFTPAKACSTRTRMRPNFRLVSFSAAVSSPPGGFFFRLARRCHCWLIPLEATILVQYCARRIDDAFLIGDGLVRHSAHVGLAQEVDALAVGGGNHHVLVAVGFLPAAVVRLLFFRVFRALAAALGAVDDAPRPCLARRCRLGEGLRVALRKNPQLVEGLPKDGQESMQPVVYPRLAQAEEFRHDDLQR